MMRGVTPRWRAAVIALVVLAGLGVRAEAQRSLSTLDSWRQVRYGATEGIASPLISGLAESAQGTLWVAHENGIAWFDGWKWNEVIPTPQTRQRSVFRLRPMHGDSMLVVRHNLLYAGDTSGFTKIVVRVDSAEQAVRDAVWTTEGIVMLVGNEDSPDSLRLMRWRGGRVEPLDPPAPLRYRDISSLHPAPDGGAWLNTTSGLWRWRDGGWHLRVPSEGRTVQVPYLFEGRGGNVMASLIGAAGGDGTWTWSGTGAPRRERTEGDQPLLDGIEDSDGSLIGVHRGGYLRRKRGDRWASFGAEGLVVRDVRTVLRDRTGDLWLGTGQGLLLLRESSDLWGGIPHGFPSMRDRVHALVTDRAGDLWAATADGIDVFASDGRIRHITAAAGVTLNAVTTLARDSVGNIWVGSGRGMIGALRWDGRTWRHYTQKDGLGAEHVHRIVVAPRGAVWFLGIGGGDFRLDDGPGAFVLDSGRFRPVGTAQGLPSGRMYDFAEARDGTQWFASGRGLSRLRAGVWTHWTERRGRIGSMGYRADIRVFTVDVDAAGRPWFGDAFTEFSYGLGTVDADTLAFLTVDQGLLSNLIRSVRVGPDSTVWVGTTNGLSAYRNGTFYDFGTDRGLGFPLIWPVFVTDSLVTVGTLGGGVRQLSLAATTVPAPRVFIAAPTGGTGFVNLQWTPLAWRGSLPSALIDTRYRIDGGAWSEWTTARSVVPRFDGGPHVFEVQAKSLYAGADGPIARAEFDVAGPLLTRPAFVVPLAVLTLSLIALLVSGVRQQQRNAIVLKESEGRFRALSASTSEGITISVDGRIVDANEQMHRLMRVADGTLRGRETPSLFGATPASAAAGELVSLTVRRDDGTAFPAEVVERSVPYFGADARVTAVRDLSEREAADRALRASEERFETLFRKSPTPITLTTWPEGLIVEVSEGFEAAVGIARADAIGRTAIDLGLYRDLDQRAELFRRIAEHGRVRGMELELLPRQGEPRSILGTFVRLDVDGRSHVLGVLTDITERRALEAQLLQSQKMEAIGRLAGGVAHDFNNLLTVILGNAELLRQSVSDSGAQSDLNEIHEAAQRASDLTRQLLTFARKQRISPKDVELDDVVPRVQKMLGRLLGERIVVEALLAPDTPTVLMDPGQLEQVLVNLAVNARDAMPQGGRLTIETEAVELDEQYAREHAHIQAGRFALISISDTGIGIPDDVLPRIFEPFFTTKEVGQGTGLGLAICYGIVREAGGHIAVYSELGRGTTVRIYLPARSREDRPVPAAEPRVLPGGRETILLVEDEALVRNLVERVLRSLGYRVTSAEDHAQALVILPTIDPPPDLLLTDVVLPGPGGAEIAKTVRARVPGIPVLYISGYTERGANATAELDAPLLSKPFTPEQLATAVRRELDGTRPRPSETDSGPRP